MPIESQRPSDASDGSIGDAYLAAARHTLASALAKITHCLDQLADEDLWWRPFAEANSIENIVLHLCGNVHQWISSAVGGVPDTRDRRAEFAERREIPKTELLARLRACIAEADAALAACATGSLLDRRIVQTFDTTKLAAIFDCVRHFVGHTHQIVQITRLRLGSRYRFQFVPTQEQGG